MLHNNHAERRFFLASHCFNPRRSVRQQSIFAFSYFSFIIIVDVFVRFCFLIFCAVWVSRFTFKTKCCVLWSFVLFSNNSNIVSPDLTQRYRSK